MIGWKSASVDPRIASFRFRVQKPVAALSERGHPVELFRAEALPRYGTVVFSKSYSADDLQIAMAVKERGGRVVFDLCDNHFYNPDELPRYVRARREMLAMMALADRVTCSTAALAAVVDDVTQGRVSATVVSDIAEGLPAPARNEPKSPVDLLWFGSHGSPNAPSGMVDLLLIRERLEVLAAQTPLRLTVCSNNRARFDEIVAPFGLPTRYVEWSTAHQEAELARADLVVLPVTMNPFTACKTHNRLTTALYAGRPVVAGAIESYREFEPFCTLDDWDEGLRRCIADPVGAAARAVAARPYIDEHYSEGAIARTWEAALDLTVAKAPKRKRRPVDAARYLGRLDAVASGAVTGWVQNILVPGQVVEVVLECDGETVAAAKADLPRGDLRNVRMPRPDCGFAIPLHDIGIADPSSLKVRVAGAGWLVGENPIVLKADHGEDITQLVPPSPSPSRGDLEETHLPIATPASADAQRRLFEEVQAVEALVFELRRVLARAVVGFGDDPALADALRQALGARGRDGHRTDDTAPSASPESSDRAPRGASSEASY